MRLGQVARKLNVGTSTVVEHLTSQGFAVENKPNAKITADQFAILSEAFADAVTDKQTASEIAIGESYAPVTLTKDPPSEKASSATQSSSPQAPEERTVSPTQEPDEGSSTPNTSSEKLKGLTVVGKIDLPPENRFRPVVSSDNSKDRARISNRSKYRKEKRSAVAEANKEASLQSQEASKTLSVTEFISTNDLASLMGVGVNEVISKCLGLGMVTSINQRLDAEAITVIVDEFGYHVEFIDVQKSTEKNIEDEEDSPDMLEERAPIVTWARSVHSHACTGCTHYRYRYHCSCR